MQRLYHLYEDLDLRLIDELELKDGDDAPMSIASHPGVGCLYRSRIRQIVLSGSGRDVGLWN